MSVLPLASLVVDEVDDNDDGGQDAEADCQRYSSVEPYIDTMLRVYTYTGHLCTTYSVSQKNIPLRFSEFFPQRLRVFKQNVYMPVVCSYPHQITKFIISKSDTVTPYIKMNFYCLTINNGLKHNYNF